MHISMSTPPKGSTRWLSLDGIGDPVASIPTGLFSQGVTSTHYMDNLISIL